MKPTKLEKALLEALEHIASYTGNLDSGDAYDMQGIATKAINKAKIISLIHKAKINESLDLSRLHDRFTEVTFDYDRREDEYSWSARTKHSVVPVFPMQSSQYVKYFKTLDGAKRNFLRRL